MEIAESKVIEVNNEVIFAYTMKPSYIIWCPKCNKEAEKLQIKVEDNGDINYCCSNCGTKIEWKENK